MFKYTKHTLKKIEDLFKEFDYVIRYEKGNFQSGYCIVENRRIAVINRFYDTEARINCLLEILSTIKVEVTELSDKSVEFYGKLQKVITANFSEGTDGMEEATEETASEEETTEVGVEEAMEEKAEVTTIEEPNPEEIKKGED